MIPMNPEGAFEVVNVRPSEVWRRIFDDEVLRKKLKESLNDLQPSAMWPFCMDATWDERLADALAPILAKKLSVRVQ